MAIQPSIRYCTSKKRQWSLYKVKILQGSLMKVCLLNTCWLAWRRDPAWLRNVALCSPCDHENKALVLFCGILGVLVTFLYLDCLRFKTTQQYRITILGMRAWGIMCLDSLLLHLYSCVFKGIWCSIKDSYPLLLLRNIFKGKFLSWCYNHTLLPSYTGSGRTS